MSDCKSQVSSEFEFHSFENSRSIGMGDKRLPVGIGPLEFRQFARRQDGLKHKLQFGVVFQSCQHWAEGAEIKSLRFTAPLRDQRMFCQSLVAFDCWCGLGPRYSRINRCFGPSADLVKPPVA